MSLFENPLKRLADFESLEESIKKEKFPVQVSDMSEPGKAHLISELMKEEKAWKLVISYDEDNASRLYEDIGCFLDEVYLYPARDLLFFTADIRSSQITAKRVEVWKHLREDKSGVIVTTVDALMDKLEDYHKFCEATLEIKKEDIIDIEKISKKLTDIGYERSFETSNPGQFSIRGGIMDIFPLTEEYPVRIELWDDEIDAMKSFDPASQRSIDELDYVNIYPAREKVLGGEQSFLRYFDYNNTLIYIDEPARTMDKARKTEDEYNQSAAGRIESGQYKKEDIPDIFGADEVFHSLNKAPSIALTGLDNRIKELEIKAMYSVFSRMSGVYHEDFTNLVDDLKKYRADKTRVALVCASKTRAKRLADSFRNDYSLDAFFSEGEKDISIAPGQIAIFVGNIHSGFEYPAINFALISETDIFKTPKKKKRREKEYEGDRVTSLSELHIGDYIVHEDHGLGIYKGIEKIERDDVIKDYVKIEYQGGDNCFVPVSKLNRIQKYGGGEIKKPKLNKLGGVEWSKTKSRVKTEVEEMAKELVELYASRLKGQGVFYGEDTLWQREFEEMFEYEETYDQIKAIEDAKRDLETGKIMDRLICGDVGYGKTEIALRIAFKVIQEGYQVLYLVPTTILARQHYNTFVQRMKDFPVKIGLLSRFNTKKEQNQTVSDLEKGLVDIVIGTHRLLSKDVAPKKLGLVIVDEEQRFGVRHKEKLKQLCENVNVLTLTATPIPRTLHMSLSGIRDLSVLEEPPVDRKPIQTYVMEYHDETVKEAIRREVARGGQVYYLYNRVNNIEEVAAHVRALLPDINVEYVHGRMDERHLEERMVDFINGDVDVLVTTTIVETGLDVPNANTIIVHDADRLGLSQLYQLRGRVGRSKRSAYAFLMYTRNKLLSEEASKRLKAIREFTELGSGIKIAMRDLEIRGAGNVLGVTQHGHMEEVGYDLYVKLLNTAVRALKTGKPVEEEVEASVEIDSSAYIPSSYISNEETKLEIYKKIALVKTEEDFLDMQDELIDRFGEMPKSVANLLYVARIKALASSMFINDIIVNKLQIKWTMRENKEIKTDNLDAFLKSFGKNLTVKYDKVLNWEYRDKEKISTEDRMEFTISLLEKMKEQLF
ncbi:transcription-repair coupling factor [Lachnoanaerobaculum sp. OBRC5-5]|uniref:transcription-repair coupling factor n=1 Tax=Lachnoanaerobaculum sp. OBRC5-5 TaxID=936595 RepID=UPI00028254AC|nr:transcription-repair coupling factor [Lachnoanaerobaculum sp. OBRC5-5]EJZ69545.1 transcription-repair coupling factor [Lachnoanaerobaculum sp. OBRC5-5]